MRKNELLPKEARGRPGDSAQPRQQSLLESKGMAALLGRTNECSDPCREDAPWLDLVIPTLEGDHLAKHGDWIIEGVQGELYPCKPDIFAATYEPVPSEGGGEGGLPPSAHRVRECLLPGLETEGLAVVDTSTPWRPIEECGELARGRYLVQLRSGAQLVALWSGDSEGWVLRQRDLDEFDSPRDITHVHQLGPIRGPEEG